MDREQLRQAFYAAPPFDLNSNEDNEYRDAIDSVISRYPNIYADYKTNK